jgi:hypothetical protein
MTIYFDKAKWTKPSTLNPKTKYSHMISDNSIDDLHKFALSIGVKRHFFHGTARIPHYDISGDQIERAKAAGAIEIRSQELVKRARNEYHY